MNTENFTNMKRNSKVIILIVITVLIGAVVAGYLIRKNKLIEFKQNGVEITATVTELVNEKSRGVRSTGRSRKSEYSVEVTYFTQIEKPDSVKNKKLISKGKDGKYKMDFSRMKPEMGDFVMTEIPISLSQFKRLKRGDKIQVVYLKDEIENAILKEDIE